jgi:hypothetical protein
LLKEIQSLIRPLEKKLDGLTGSSNKTLMAEQKQQQQKVPPKVQEQTTQIRNKFREQMELEREKKNKQFENLMHSTLQVPNIPGVKTPNKIMMNEVMDDLDEDGPKMFVQEGQEEQYESYDPTLYDDDAEDIAEIYGEMWKKNKLI